MKKFTLGSMLALALAVLSACAPANQTSSSQADQSADNIVRGKVVQANDALVKQLVMLYGITNEGGQQSAFICTATLISPTVALTAAHCADGALRIYAVFGNDGIAVLKNGNPNNDPNIIRVSASRIYPDWAGSKDGAVEKQTDAGDLAILKLSRPAPSTAVVTKLFTSSLKKSETLLAAGYGIDSVGQTAKDSSGLLREANVIVSEPLLGKSEFMVDQRGKNGGPCSGDSGGPSFVQTSSGELQQVGIVSRGDQNCSIGGIYTLVPAYTSWISSTMASL